MEKVEFLIQTTATASDELMPPINNNNNDEKNMSALLPQITFTVHRGTDTLTQMDLVISGM